MLNKLSTLCLALSCCGILYFAISYGMANVYSNAVASTHSFWAEESNRPNTIEHLSETTSLVNGMLNLQPSHPYYLTLAANHFAWSAFFKQDQADLYRAIDYEKAGMLLRPAWPQHYAQLAFYYWQLGDKTTAYTYLEQAIKFGPYDQDTAEKVIEFGIADWDSLTTKQRIYFSHTLIKQLNSYRYRPRVEMIISRAKNKEKACNLIKFSQIHLSTCEHNSK